MAPHLQSGIYRGTVMHARRAPVTHGFRYRSWFVVLDLHELPELERRWRPLGLPLFGHGRFGIARLDDDHYQGDMTSGLRGNVIEWVRTRGLDVDDDARVMLGTTLRQLGYAFNPISVFWVWASRTASDPLACVVEVHNTFGESHRYLAPAGDAPSEHDKRLHVSPFMPMDQRYRMRLPVPAERFLVGVDVLDERQPLHATWTGRRMEPTAGNLLRTILRFPIGPLLVTARIHLQALRLWRLRVPIHRKPPFIEGEGTIAPTTATPTRATPR